MVEALESQGVSGSGVMLQKKYFEKGVDRYMHHGVCLWHQQMHTSVHISMMGRQQSKAQVERPAAER